MQNERDFHRRRTAFVILSAGILVAFDGFEGSHADLLRQSGFDERQTEKLIALRPRGFALNGIYLKTTAEMIGQCGITMQEYQNSLVHEVGYLFCADFWHQGYATEAAKAARDYAFTVLKAPRVFAFVRDTNTASMNVARRCGLKAIDIIIKHYRNVTMPHIVFDLTQKEWSLLKSQDQNS